MGTSIFDFSPDRTTETVDVADLHLVDSLREGSERAYEELLVRFQQPVYALALRLLDDQSEACDVVQEVFLKVFRNVGNADLFALPRRELRNIPAFKPDVS